MEAAEALPPSLPCLPTEVLLSVCQLLIDARGGSPRDVVSLALVCRGLREAISSADALWLEQCRRIGWR